MLLCWGVCSWGVCSVGAIAVSKATPCIPIMFNVPARKTLHYAHRTCTFSRLVTPGHGSLNVDSDTGMLQNLTTNTVSIVTNTHTNTHTAPHTQTSRHVLFVKAQPFDNR